MSVMYNHIIRILTAGAVLLTALLTSCGGKSDESMQGTTSAALEQLDEMLERRDEFAAGREMKIIASKSELATVTDAHDAYNICRTLFSAYRNYKVDSALWIANQRLRLAHALNDTSKINSASLNLAECLSAAANYSEALARLDSIPREGLAGYQRQYLYKIYCDTYRRLSLSDGLESNKLRYGMMYRQYTDSALAVIDENDPKYGYTKACRYLDAGYPDNALKEMENTVERFGPVSYDPRMMYEMGRIYHALGRQEEEIEAFTRSSLEYIRNGQRDYPSLMALAAALNDSGDPGRAYRYIMAALEDASFCNSRSRTSEIQELVPLISQAYSAMEKNSLRMAWTLIFIIILLAVATGACFLWAYGQLRKKRRMSRQLEEANCILTQINAALEDANRGKISFINSLFGIYSDYIDRIDSYRKKIMQLLRMSQPRAALDYLESNKIVSDELKDMYRRFDTMFIELFPDFIPAYNSMVAPSECLDATARSLPAKVRVLALMKIGITEPAAIARLLHYTPQTIYNYCSQLRASSTVPYDEFEKTIFADSDIL